MTADKAKHTVGRYVLAEIEGEWHVMFAPDALSHHYLSVARFSEYRRARSYCEVEEMMHEDSSLGDALDVRAIVEVPKENLVIKPPDAPRPKTPPPKPDVKRPLSDLESEMLSDLAELMKTHRTGVTAKDFAEWYGEVETICSDAMRTLDQRNLARVSIAPGGTIERLTPTDFRLPAMPLDKAQSAMHDAMKSLETDGVVRASHRMLAEKTGLSIGSVPRTLSALVAIGAVTPLEGGGPQMPAAYKLGPPPCAN